MNDAILHWNQKYPLAVNTWTPKDLDRESLFPKFKKLENCAEIQDQFPLIKYSFLICKLIEENYPIRKHRDEKTSKTIHNQIKTIHALFLSCKAFYNSNGLQKLHETLKKDWLLQNYKTYKLGKGLHYPYPGGPGWLNEIFLTGWQHGHHYKVDNLSVPVRDRKWNATYEEDVKEIIKSVPQSLNCTTLGMRAGYAISPFAIACWNEKVPLSMVKFLLENKADPKQQHLPSNKYGWSHWIDLKSEIGEERVKAILEMINNLESK